MRRGRLALFALALGWSAATTSTPAPAWAQTEQDLEAARKTFAEAMKDEEAKRFDDALAKFRVVQRVKDTVNVRYRIASCLDASGKLAQALTAYTETAEFGRGDKAAAEVVRAATERAAQLDKVVARLTLVVVPRPDDADVRVDGVKIEPSALAAPITLDPGAHTVTASAKDAPPFHSTVTLNEGGQMSITIPLEPVMTPRPSATTAPVQPPATPPAGADRGSPRWFPIALTAAGGVLLVGAAVTTALRASDIRTLRDACPDGVCRSDQRDELTSVRSRALFEGPLAIGLGVAGTAAATVGLVLLFSPKPASSPPAGAVPGHLSLAPTLAPGGGGWQLRGSF